MSKLKVDKLDSDNNHIVFGGAEHLDLSSNQGDIRLPRGTTDQRPTTVATGLKRGALYYNIDYDKLQYFNGWSWRGIDGSRDYVTEGLRLNLDAASPESFTKENAFKLPGWIYYSGGNTHSNRLDNYGVHIYNNYNSWIGYYETNINTAQKYYLEFDVWATTDNTVLVLDNDGVDNNSFNEFFTVGTEVQRITRSITFTTTGNSKFFFRRDSGGDIWMSNVRLFSAFQDELKSEECNYVQGGVRAINGVEWMPENYGHWNFDGSNDYFDLPDYDTGGNIDDSSYDQNGDSQWNAGMNSLSVTMEMIIKQVGTNKSLEIFGTSATNSAYPDSGFAYFPGSLGFFFYRFVNVSGDRPHVRAGDISLNLTDGNWHHIVGTYDQQTGYARLYRNGNLVAENNSSTLSSSFQGNFGGNATSYAFNGKAAVIRLYSNVLTAEEVKRNFNATKFRYGL